MSFTIREIRFHVRETGPARFASALGKLGQVRGQGQGLAGGQGLAAKQAERVTSPLCHVRLTLRDDGGHETFGCSADRLSVRWLDKRPERDKPRKLRELVALIEHAGRLYQEQPRFETPLEKWRREHPRIIQAGRDAGQEDLTSTFASALLERALIDGVCRARNQSFPQALESGQLGIDGRQLLPPRRSTRIAIRHTVGLFDPLTDDDWPASQRLDDGLPETLQECIRFYGLRYFKIKISGDPAADLERLQRIWELVPHEREPVLTLDANEAFDDPQRFVEFVQRLEREQLGIFQHVLFIEQPLPRHLALERRSERALRRAAELKPLVIDESDATLDAFRRAHAVGYSGTSHKNCKGVFKSLLNRRLLLELAEGDPRVMMSGEDLQNLPVVPLHQDFVAVAALGLEHCERNGHHYNFGLSMLSERDKAAVTRRHPDLYEQRGDEWFLRIRDGQVETASLHGPGFGVRDEPDWRSMEDLRTWIDRRYPAR